MKCVKCGVPLDVTNFVKVMVHAFLKRPVSFPLCKECYSKMVLGIKKD